MCTVQCAYLQKFLDGILIILLASCDQAVDGGGGVSEHRVEAEAVSTSVPVVVFHCHRT